MEVQLPNLNLNLKTDNLQKFEKIRHVKALLTSVLSYWFDISETKKTYFNNIEDYEYEMGRLRGARNYANPRLINYLIQSRSQERRALHDINGSIYGAMGHGIKYEGDNPDLTPRILTIGHAFSHFDSTLELTRGLSNPNKSHFIMDVLIFQANNFYSDVEIGIIKTLLKSRLKNFLATDFSEQSFKDDQDNNLRRIREMFLVKALTNMVAKITELDVLPDFQVHTNFYSKEFHKRLTKYFTQEDLQEVNFIEFMNAFLDSSRTGGGYKVNEIESLQVLLALYKEQNVFGFNELAKILELLKQDENNRSHLEQEVLPVFDQFLQNEIQSEYARANNEQTNVE